MGAAARDVFACAGPSRLRRQPFGEDFTPSIPGYARALESFLNALELEKAILVGHSLGGAVVMDLAVQTPERFPGMLLLDPSPPTGMRTPRFFYPLLRSYRHDHEALARSLRRAMPSRVPPYLGDLAEEADRMHPDSFSGNARALADWDVSGELHHYSNPVIVASGGKDKLVAPYSARHTAGAFPDGCYEQLESVGHSPQIEAPGAVRDLLISIVEASRTSSPIKNRKKSHLLANRIARSRNKLRPLVERGRKMVRSAIAYLRAAK